MVDGDLEESDVVLRQDKLAWFASPDLVLDDAGHVPFVTFGPHCFYRPIAEERLREAGMNYSGSVECESTAGVVAAVEAGLGATLLNTSHPQAPDSWPVSRTWSCQRTCPTSSS